MEFNKKNFPSVAALVAISQYFSEDKGAQAILAAVEDAMNRGTKEAQLPGNFNANVAKYFTADQRTSYVNLCEAYRDNYEGRYLTDYKTQALLNILK